MADVPLILGTFQLQAPVARGGMGVFWRGHHTEDGTQVAVKVLTGARARRRKPIAKFDREVQSVAALCHPAIVRVHDCGLVSAEASATRS